jgi:AcrR family transcriptional regulator
MKTIDSKHSTTPKRTSDIIQAALMCFTEIGYNSTSMSDICTRANASIGSIYHHFKSKEQLAASVYLEGIEVYQLGMLEIINKEVDAKNGISSIITYHFQWILKNPDWALFLFQKRHSFNTIEIENQLNTLNIKFTNEISEWFKIHILSGEVHQFSFDLIFSLLFGPSLEYTRFYLSNKGSKKIDDAIKSLINAALSSLLK